MKTLWDCSKRVVFNSMKISGEKVHSSIPLNLDLPVEIRDCAVSFDASWHRRGHFFNQGFAAAIDSEFGKVLDYQLYDRICYHCCKWTEERKADNPEEFLEITISYTAHI